MSNGERSGGSTAADFSIESQSERYAEDKCRGVIMEPISLEICTTTTTTTKTQFFSLLIIQFQFSFLVKYPIVIYTCVLHMAMIPK